MNLFRCFAISFALSFAAACSSGPGTDFKVASPDGTLCVGIRAADSLTYTVTRHGTPVLLPSAIGLHFADGTVLGRGAKVTDARRETVERVVEAPFYRQARFTEHYNQLRLTFEGGYAVTFRVFDQGCAYRIETHLPGERTVAGEVAEFNFAGDPGLFAAYSDGLCNAYQSQYEKCRLSALGTEKPVLLPLAADCGAAGRVLVCEADLEAYPGIHYLSLHQSEFARKAGWDKAYLPQSDRYTECLLRLPMFYELTHEEVDRICDVVRDFYNHQ